MPPKKVQDQVQPTRKKRANSRLRAQKDRERKRRQREESQQQKRELEDLQMDLGYIQQDVESGSQDGASQESEEEKDYDACVDPTSYLQIQKSIISLKHSIKHQSRKHTTQIKALAKGIEQLQQENADLKSMVRDLTHVVSNFLQAQPVSPYEHSTSLNHITLLTQVLESKRMYSPNFSEDVLRYQIERFETYTEQIKLRLYHDTPIFWKYYEELYYVQMAVYVTALTKKRYRPRTIENNLNAMRIFSKLWRDSGLKQLKIAEIQDSPDLIKAQFISVRKLSTLNQYLRCVTTMVKTVWQMNDVRVSIEEKHFKTDQKLITEDDIKSIIKVCRESDDEPLQMVGFFIYLLYITAARNETIRTLEFTQFVEDESKYFLRLYASKTSKSLVIQIPSEVYQQVQTIKADRDAWVKNAQKRLKIKIKGKYATEEFQKRRLELINRRQKYVFTFFTEPAIHYHIKKIKALPETKDIKDLGAFIIHNIRKIAIIAAYNRAGIEAARELADHAKAETTYKHYIIRNRVAGTQWVIPSKPKLGKKEEQQLESLERYEEKDKDALDQFNRIEEIRKTDEVNNLNIQNKVSEERVYLNEEDQKKADQERADFQLAQQSMGDANTKPEIVSQEEEKLVVYRDNEDELRLCVVTEEELKKLDVDESKLCCLPSLEFKDLDKYPYVISESDESDSEEDDGSDSDNEKDKDQKNFDDKDSDEDKDVDMIDTTAAKKRK